MRRVSLSPGSRRSGAGPGRVLIGVDFDAPSLAAARWITRHLAPDAEVVLAHVLPVPDAPAFLRRHVRAPDPIVREVTGPLRGGLGGLAATLGAARVRIELRVGEPAEQLAALAAEHAVDLVCVGRGRRQRSDTGRRGRNTVERLLRRTTVPLLQASGPLDAPPTSVLAAVDGGPASDQILRQAWALAARAEARLTGLHVLEEDVRAYVRAMEVALGAAPRAHAAEEALWTDAAEWVRGVLEASDARPGRAHAMVSAGDPGQEILAAGRRVGADLIVVGRSGRDALAPLAVGSTTRLVLRGARCPVLVVPDVPAPITPTDGGGRRARVSLAVRREAPAVLRPAVRELGGPDDGGFPPAALARSA